jgi:Tfp pilus assembly protein PilZ
MTFTQLFCELLPWLQLGSLFLPTSADFSDGGTLPEARLLSGSHVA